MGDSRSRCEHSSHSQLIFVDESKFAAKELAQARKVGPHGTERIIINYRPNERTLNLGPRRPHFRAGCQYRINYFCTGPLHLRLLCPVRFEQRAVAARI